MRKSSLKTMDNTTRKKIANAKRIQKETAKAVKKHQKTQAKVLIYKAKKQEASSALKDNKNAEQIARLRKQIQEHQKKMDFWQREERAARKERAKLEKKMAKNGPLLGLLALDAVNTVATVIAVL